MNTLGVQAGRFDIIVQFALVKIPRVFLLDLSDFYKGCPKFKSYQFYFQMMKWAWVQYASVLIIFIAIFRQIKIFVFQKQILPTFPSITSNEIEVLKSKPF